VVSLISLFSPPFLAFFVWKKFLQSTAHLERPQWKTIVERIAILSVSGFFVVCVLWIVAVNFDCLMVDMMA
jgi:hypothetical protein